MSESIAMIESRPSWLRRRRGRIIWLVVLSVVTFLGFKLDAAIKRVRQAADRSQSQ